MTELMGRLGDVCPMGEYFFECYEKVSEAIVGLRSQLLSKFLVTQ